MEFMSAKDTEKLVDFITTRHDAGKAAKPFLKWAGGKGQLIKNIEKYYPFSCAEITKYAEPFVGGGAVLFDVLNKHDINEVYINDINPDLINAYRIIRDDINGLIAKLSVMQEEYQSAGTEQRKELYSAQRLRFNEIKASPKPATDVERAALIIFLNKSCFNGLYRVNRKGMFNVPIGAYKKPLICDENNLRAVSDKLRNVRIVCGDYKDSAEFIDKHTFVYFDPPYRPLTDTASFTAYSENQFNDEKQIELADFAGKISKRGAKVLISNSDPKNADSSDDFFDKLYSSYRIERVEAARMINCNSEARGKIKELLISNY
ncbi:MAG: DNA adenine methylase [Eubacteriales bacterium]|nr:DNA adenine methylase [Eubacteriales bacterium]MDD3882696.1 DNA adenine methylase [Eubacteriales bacterium]MDD4512732.1 DNA adenine methylase [Eubacteriales bacterium]